MSWPLTLLLLSAPFHGEVTRPASPQEQEARGIRFGRSVITLEDQDGDGVPEFAVGAPASSVNGRAGAGRVFVFSGKTRRRLSTWTSESASSSGLGRWLERVADANDDGALDVLVGADSGRLEVRCAKTGAVVKRLEVLESGDAQGAWAATLADETTVAVPDIDGDGAADELYFNAAFGIGVIARSSALASALAGNQGQGRELWRRDWMDCGPQSAVSIDVYGDADGDGVVDVLVGTSHCITHGVPAPPTTGNVRLLSGATGEDLWIMHEEGREALETFLEENAWKHRLLVLAGPKREVEDQVQALARDVTGVLERDLIVVELTGKRAVDRIGDLTTRPPSRLVMERFDLAPETFSMLLIGKDTGIKKRYTAVTKAEDIWPVIDAMSMRRSEIEERGR